MRIIFLLFTLSFLSVSLYSQDIIYRTNGDVIECKITKEDSTTVYFTMRSNKHKIATMLNRDQIERIDYANSIKYYSNDTIVVVRGFGGFAFYRSNVVLSIKDLTELVKDNPVAYERIQAGRSANIVSNIFGFTGGFMIGWTLGTAIWGDEPNWVVGGIGVGLALISVPINSSAGRAFKEGVDIYNAGIRNASFWDDKELNFTLNDAGLGLRLSF